MTIPSAESRKLLRAALSKASDEALNAMLDEVRTGPSFWGNATIEVEIVCELKVRAANKELEAAYV